MPKIGGFEEPPPVSDEGSWQISGKLNGMLNVKLEPGEACCGEVGTMEYFQEGINFQTKMSSKGIGGNISSWASGESPFRQTFKNDSDKTLYVGLTPNAPLGTIIPINLSEHVGQVMNCSLGAYMGSMSEDIRTNIKLKSDSCTCMACCACCCGGPSPVVQEISTVNPANSTAFLTAMGTIVKRRLEPGETIKVDTDALVAFEDSVQFDAVANSCMMTCFGGEGLFLTTLTGKEDGPGGDIWIQTYNMDKLEKLLVTEDPPENEGGDGGGAPASSDEMER